MPEKLVLWFEDQPDVTTEYAKDLQDHFRLCTADWSPGPAHTISSALRYLLEAAFGNAEVCPLPDLILLDSKLAGDPDGNLNKPHISKLCGAEKLLKEDVKQCLADGTGAAVLRFLGRHIHQSFPNIKVVYLSQYSEKQIREDDQGNEVLAEYPGLLSGYHSKQHGPLRLRSMIFDVLQDRRRGYSLQEIRRALPAQDADYLLGTVADGFAWSDSYRLALSDLVEAGGDKAWHHRRRNGKSAKPYVSFPNPQFSDVLASHKQLPRALLHAERGCGKEGFAKALHRMWYSEDPESPFISVNIGGVPPWSAGVALQLRLFGGQQHLNQTPAYGCVPQAWNGTLLLDELGDTQKDVQDTLLRLIQEGEYEPALWKPQIWAAHCCFIGATSRDLWAEGHFRADLADRVAMHVIKIPALRDVLSDIPFWMTKIARENAITLQPFSKQSVPSKFEFPDVAGNLMQGYSWPGNLRELTHLIRRMQLSSLGRAKISLGTVSKELGRVKGVTSYDARVAAGLPNTPEELRGLLDRFSIYMRSQGNNSFSKTELYKFVSRNFAATTPFKWEKHLEKRFGITKAKIPDLLNSLAEASGGWVWGQQNQGQSQ